MFLFNKTESEHQVAGHQPEDLCQVSCGLVSYVCFWHENPAYKLHLILQFCLVAAFF